MFVLLPFLQSLNVMQVVKLFLLHQPCLLVQSSQKLKRVLHKFALFLVLMRRLQNQESHNNSSVHALLAGTNLVQVGAALLVVKVDLLMVIALVAMAALLVVISLAQVAMPALPVVISLAQVAMVVLLVVTSLAQVAMAGLLVVHRVLTILVVSAQLLQPRKHQCRAIAQSKAVKNAKRADVLLSLAIHAKRVMIQVGAKTLAAEVRDASLKTMPHLVERSQLKPLSVLLR